MGTTIPIMMDIKGPEIRIGKLKEGRYELTAGNMLILTTEDILGDSERISVNYSELPLVVEPNSKILIDDGLIELRVLSVTETEIYCLILNGGPLKPRKGVNLPGIRTTLPGVTERDIRHIEFGVEHKIDIIAMSFVRKAEDVLSVKHLLEQQDSSHVQIISKIENMEGVEQLDAIIEASDGIMVARGDLGVEVPVEDVPIIQKTMIEKCNKAGKPVIVATHMLESMQINPRPTRAEANDVANSVMQGTDAVMLSGETAAGKYPVESVRTMASIAHKAETLFVQNPPNRSSQALTVTEVISQSAVNASYALQASAILTPTESGFTARMVAKQRPAAPIIAITQDDNVLSRLCLVWGVYPVKGSTSSSTDELFRSAINNGLRTGLIQEGDTAVITAGVPIGQTGATNLIKILQV
jgi:pyruvate kinase